MVFLLVQNGVDLRHNRGTPMPESLVFQGCSGGASVQETSGGDQVRHTHTLNWPGLVPSHPHVLLAVMSARKQIAE
jgi:hypothetical protein